MTAAPKFTPAPWTYQRTQTGVFCIDHPTGQSSDPVATVWCVSLEDDSKNGAAFVEAKKANARLIAAAPELYEALRELLDVTDGCMDGAHVDNRTNIAFATARGALAKVSP